MSHGVGAISQTGTNAAQIITQQVLGAVSGQSSAGNAGQLASQILGIMYTYSAPTDPAQLSDAILSEDGPVALYRLDPQTEAALQLLRTTLTRRFDVHA